jgi:hypothetical protein
VGNAGSRTAPRRAVGGCLTATSCKACPAEWRTITRIFFNATYINFDGSVFRLPIFTNFDVSQLYWTSTTDAANTSEAWTVFSCDFGVYDIPRTNTGYTLAVR